MEPYIFLDIDGTVSSSIHQIDDAVAAYLSDLSFKGYLLVFVTGRSYQWAERALSFLKTPYVLAVQNGAVIKSMPKEKIISLSYIPKEWLKQINLVSDQYVVYTGEENHFRCYYLADTTEHEKELLLNRAKAIGEEWISLQSFDELPVDAFPAFKFFGDVRSLQIVSAKIRSSLNISIPVILDPVLKGRAVAQGTLTNKGSVVDVIKNLYGNNTVIAAGDDMNDFEMLQKADIKIVIETAPKEILELADIICPQKLGIIEGLNKALLWKL